MVKTVECTLEVHFSPVFCEFTGRILDIREAKGKHAKMSPLRQFEPPSVSEENRGRLYLPRLLSTFREKRGPQPPDKGKEGGTG